MEEYSRKLILFDLDTNVLKAIHGEDGYTRGWSDVRRVLEQNDFIHIQGSVYASTQIMNSTQVLYVVEKLKTKYPYLTKAIRKIQHANFDIGEMYSLEDAVEYDGTPGIFAKEKNENTSTKQEQYGFDEDQLRQDAAELLEDAAATQSPKLIR